MGQSVINRQCWGAKRFLIGQGGVEIGLEEAVLHLRKGDRATLILPSHLAHGLRDDDKIAWCHHSIRFNGY